MDSLNNSSFMNWLKEYLTQNSDISGNIVFSITSYSAYLNKTLFETFTKEIREYGVKTLIKRYKLEEYPIEQLDGLEVDYIRMHKDYTANFTSDIAKKLSLNPSDVSRHMITSSRHGMVRYDTHSKCYARVQ